MSENLRNVPDSEKSNGVVPDLPQESVKFGIEETIEAIVKPVLPERYKLKHSGKVRETYENPDNPNQLIIIATDRISTHDIVHKSAIPGKGTALTQISNFWFDYLSKDERTKDIPSQVISPQVLPDDFPEELKSRAIVVKKLNPLPIEAIVRGYLYGSALKGYNSHTGLLKTGEPIGVNLEKCSEIQPPLFTPSTKVEGGHDVNVNFNEMVDHLSTYFGGDKVRALDLAVEIKNKSLLIYKVVNEEAQRRGVILGDTKFEFGLDENGVLHLIDEVATPDSSRYWNKDSVLPGKEPISNDKQAVRDYVVKESKRQGLEAGDIAIELPPEVINETVKTYGRMANLFS